MKHDDPWANIGVRSKEVFGRRISEGHSLAIYWVRNDDGALGLLVKGLDFDRMPKTITKLRGINIITTIEGLSSSLNLTLQQEQSKEVFLVLCRDLITTSSREASSSGATASIFLRLARWHALLSKSALAVMSSQEVRGLIGELCFLEQSSQSSGALASLHSWVAPDDHPQDFANERSVVEVKTRIAGSRPHVQISSLDQLQASHLPLYLAVVELAPSGAASGFSLNDIVCRLNKIYDEGHLRELFENRLALRGYIPLDVYSEERYEMAGVRYFIVSEGFPRLTRASVDRGVYQATYTLDLTAIAAYEQPFGDWHLPASPRTS